MEKLIYLLHKPADRKITEDFTRRVASILVPRLNRVGAHDILFTVADLNDKIRRESPSRLMGNWESIAGALHFWLDSVDDRTRLEPMMRQFNPDISGYLVTESVVQSAPRTWKDGERRPGITQLAVLHKSPAISEEEFYHNWHVGHSPITFDIHPWRTDYIRNAVVRSLTPGASPFRIIVLEKWSELRDYTEDDRYLGKEAAQQAFDGPPFANWDTRIVGPTSEYAFA